MSDINSESTLLALVPALGDSSNHSFVGSSFSQETQQLPNSKIYLPYAIVTILGLCILFSLILILIIDRSKDGSSFFTIMKYSILFSMVTSIIFAGYLFYTIPLS